MDAPVLPSVAVIVPTWNEARGVGAAVERLLAAADPLERADEVIVGDGGSDDGTPTLARAAGARVVEGERGRGRQLARAAREARADVLVFLHADNALARGALSCIRRSFARPELGAAALRQRIDAPGWFYRAVERAADRRVKRGMVYGDSTLCVRRALYEALGGFADLPLFEDVEFSQRLRRATRIELLDGPPVLVDARRWRREGRLRATLRNWLLRAAWSAGAAPQRLARWYPLHGRAADDPRAANR
jgi:rSAM/selenodomain-associated transferase 2